MSPLAWPPSLKLLMLLALLLLGGRDGASGCGMVQHNEIAHRARQLLALPLRWGDRPPEWLLTLLSENLGSLLAGAPAPDFGYVCFAHDAAEAMHWTPFQVASPAVVAAVKHLHSRYGRDPRQWSQSGQQLAAFLFGVASHMIADINWHGLGEDWPAWRVPPGRGYLKEQGGVNFRCDGSLCQQSHTTGDTGGEFVLAMQSPLDWMSLEWVLPVGDLVNILSGMNYTIQAVDLIECASMFLAASNLIPLVAHRLEPRFSRAAPYLPDMMQGHYLGGVDDNALWTLRKWTQVAGWVDGKDNMPEASSSAEQAQSSSDTPASMRAQLEVLMGGLDRAAISDLVVGEAGEGSVRLKMREGWAEHAAGVASGEASSSVVGLMPVPGMAEGTGADLRPDGEAGRTDRLQSQAEVRLQHDGQPFGHFGGAVLANCDFSGDGLPDLLVSAPGATVAGSGQGPQTGLVYMYHSNKSRPTIWSSQPVAVFSGTEARFDQDSYSGAVYIFRGPSDYAWFGAAMDVLPHGATGAGNGALLAVGSPGSRVSQGRIDVFCIANGSIVVLPVNKKAISGSDQANDSADHRVMHGTVTAGGLGYRMLAIHPLRLLGDPAKNHSRSRGPQAAGHPSSHLFLVSQPFARGSPSDEQQYEAGLGAILLLGDGLAAWLSALALLFCLCCNACGRLGARHLEHGTPPVRKPKQLAHPGGGGAAHMLLLAIATSTAVGFLALCTLRLGDTLGHEIGAARLAPKELVGAVFVFDANLPPGRVSTAAAVAVAAGRSGPNGRFGDGLAASWVPTASGGGKLVLASGEPNAHDSSADDASGRSNSKPWQQAGETWISQHFLG
eukprot:jgi/Tetstr1/455040/TSEL_041896.t1